MATLTRGISFRRQGSSGMSWAENWTFTDQGMFRKQDQDPAGMEHPAPLGQISAISATIDSDAKAAQLSRSRSVGSVGSTVGTAMHIFSPVLELKDHNPSKSNSATTTAAATPVVELKPPIKSCPDTHTTTSKSKGFSVLRWLKKRFGMKRIGARI